MPYSIADLTIGNEKSLRDGFLHWIKVNDHRFAIDWVLDLLHVPAFCRRFAFDESEIASIRQMVQQANMRWGYDEKQRQDLGLWPTSEHTLRHGSLRYLYGFVGIPKGHADALGVAVSPLEPGSQDSADTLGKWMMMTTQLKRFADALQAKRSITGWASFLQDEMERFFTADEEEARPLSLLLQQLYDAGESIAFQGDIPFAIIQKWLLQHAPQEMRPGLFQGGVTFAAMLAERVFAKKIIALLGMGQEDFPRQENRLSFDLLAPQDGKRHSMAGDPNHDEEDRYFFLQNVLAAKDALYISYVGQDPKTGEAKMPANVVNELLDWLKQKGIPAEKIVKAHPVLAYDPIYFQEDGDFFTYDESVARALNYPASANLSDLPLQSSLQNHNAILPAEIRLDDLVAFFKNTSRAFLQNFGIQVPETEEVPQEREPFGKPHSLEAYTLQNHILKDQLAGVLPETSKALLRSQGLLPHGISGDEIFAKAWQSIEPLAQKIILEAPRPYAIAIDLGNCRLVGQVTVHQDRGVLAYVPKKDASASDEVAFFLQHLALCVETKEHNVQSRLYAIEQLKDRKAGCLSLQKGTLDDRGTLKQLMELYQCGIKQPLPFFPKSSKKFHQCRNDPKKNADACREARKTWEGDEHSFGESQNPWHHYLYRDSSPVVDHSSFAEIAALFWGFYDDYRG
jgi:exodeoxyribonuclease V gamma subunit